MRHKLSYDDIREALQRRLQMSPERRGGLTEWSSDFRGALACIEREQNVAGDVSLRFQFYSTMVHIVGGRGIPFRRTNPLPRRSGPHDRTTRLPCLFTIITTRVWDDSTEIILHKISSQPLLSWRIKNGSKGQSQQSVWSFESYKHQVDVLIIRKDRNPSRYFSFDLWAGWVAGASIECFAYRFEVPRLKWYKEDILRTNERVIDIWHPSNRYCFDIKHKTFIFVGHPFEISDDVILIRRMASVGCQVQPRCSDWGGWDHDTSPRNIDTQDRNLFDPIPNLWFGWFGNG